MKRCSCLLILILNVGTMLSAAAQSEEDLGRFFLERNTRNQLNQAREQYSAIGPVTEDEKAPQDTLFPEVKVKGLVVRSDGSSEIWLNNASTVGKDGISQEVRSVTKRVNRERVQVTLPDGKYVTLMPGQVYTPDSQKVLELYQTQMPAEPIEPAPEDKTPENPEEQAGTEEPEEDKGFDESILAETDTKIKLLEERIQKLEGKF